MTQDQEIHDFYGMLFKRFGAIENHFYNPLIEDDSEEYLTGCDVSIETFAVIQSLLAKTGHVKLNLRPKTEAPVDYLVENAKLDGAIEAFRAMLDMFHQARQIKLMRVNPRYFQNSEN